MQLESHFHDDFVSNPIGHLNGVEGSRQQSSKYKILKLLHIYE